MNYDMTILAVDDTGTSLFLLNEILSAVGYRVRPADSGELALAAIAAEPPDLILLDVRMPGIGGFEVCRRLKADPRTCDIPVLFLSGLNEESERLEGLRLGASDFIAKLPHVVQDNLEKHEMKRRNRELESQLRESYKQLKQLNKELEQKVQVRTEELERAYQLSNELMAKAVDSNMQLAELYSEVDEARRKLDEKLRQMAMLNELGRKMAATFEQDRLLQVAMDSIYQELNVEHCAILLLHEQSARFRIGASGLLNDIEAVLGGGDPAPSNGY